MEDASLPVLLITANVGSIFEDVSICRANASNPYIRRAHVCFVQSSKSQRFYQYPGMRSMLALSVEPLAIWSLYGLWEVKKRFDAPLHRLLDLNEKSALSLFT